MKEVWHSTRVTLIPTPFTSLLNFYRPCIMSYMQSSFTCIVLACEYPWSKHLAGRPIVWGFKLPLPLQERLLEHFTYSLIQGFSTFTKCGATFTPYQLADCKVLNESTMILGLLLQTGSHTGQ